MGNTLRIIRCGTWLGDSSYESCYEPVFSPGKEIQGAVYMHVDPSFSEISNKIIVIFSSALSLLNKCMKAYVCLVLSRPSVHQRQRFFVS